MILEDIGAVIRALLYFECREQAAKMQQQFASYLQMIETNMALLTPLADQTTVGGNNTNFLNKVEWQLRLFSPQ
jgi:hypothetical protein